MDPPRWRLTIGLGKEVAAEGVRVNAVRPGVIHTDIRRWLASDEASYITATIVNCSGGR